MDLRELDIEGFGHGGEGFARVAEGFVSVPRALPGERVEVRVGDFVRGRAWGEVTRLLRPSPTRVEPDCHHFSHCSGCALRHLSRGDERALKLAQAAQVLDRYGPPEPPASIDWVGGEERLGHRTRGRFAVTTRAGDVLVGLRGIDLRRSIVDVRDCPAQSPRFREVMSAAAEILDQVPAAAATIDTIELEIADPRGRLGLNATRRPEEAALDGFVALAEREGLGLTLRLEGDPPTHLAGPRQLHLTFPSGGGGRPGLAVELRRDVWHHASPHLGQRLGDWVVEQVVEHDTKRLLDLCCGIGTITSRLAPLSDEVVAIDESQPAVEALRMALSGAGLSNVEVRAGRIGAVLRKLRRDPARRAELAVVNPMRRPLGRRQLRDLPSLGVKRVIYAGPAPVSAARDAAFLAELGYRLRRVAAIDLHPGTAQFMLGFVADR